MSPRVLSPNMHPIVPQTPSMLDLLARPGLTSTQPLGAATTRWQLQRAAWMRPGLAKMSTIEGFSGQMRSIFGLSTLKIGGGGGGGEYQPNWGPCGRVLTPRGFQTQRITSTQRCKIPGFDSNGY